MPNITKTIDGQTRVCAHAFAPKHVDYMHALSGSTGWTDAHIPRTPAPVRFCYLTDAPDSRPCIARGYMGYALPVRFPRS